MEKSFRYYFWGMLPELRQRGWACGMWLLLGVAGPPAGAWAQSLPPPENTAVADGLHAWCVVDSGRARCLEPVAAFYAQGCYVPVWTQPNGPTVGAWAGVQLLAQAPRYGLRPADYEAAPLRLLLDSLGAPPDSLATGRRVRAEVQLTAALLRFARHLASGRLQGPGLRPAATVPQPGPDLVALLRRAVASGPQALAGVLLKIQPTSRSYVRLVWAWQRLLADDTAAASRLALPVALSLERLRWEPPADSLVLVVNVPGFGLEVVRGPQVVARYRVVVGKAATPTPQLYSRVTFFEAAPAWRVPGRIAASELLPRLQRSPGALAGLGFGVYTPAGQRVNPRRVAWAKVPSNSFPYQIRQAPSADNALGNVVFRFANPYEVYLHDTPARAAFRAPNRALSHGCIRVEHAVDLARFLLLRDDALPSDRRTHRLETSLNRGQTTTFRLRAPALLLVRYLTCEADGPALRQWPDVYGRDAALALAWQATGPALTEVLVLR